MLCLPAGFRKFLVKRRTRCPLHAPVHVAGDTVTPCTSPSRSMSVGRRHRKSRLVAFFYGGPEPLPDQCGALGCGFSSSRISIGFPSAIPKNSVVCRQPIFPWKGLRQVSKAAIDGANFAFEIHGQGCRQMDRSCRESLSRDLASFKEILGWLSLGRARIFYYRVPDQAFSSAIS